MRSKKTLLTSFSHARSSESFCLRPDNEKQLIDYIINKKPNNLLTRGSGLSYNDSCLNKDKLVIDTRRFNHLLSFDSNSGVVVCQGGVTFKDLFLLHPDFIPPVIPGTVHATVAGGVAHDVHGKNNHTEGSFGNHVSWLELIINGQEIHCSREENPLLFHATIAGLGLTGIISRIAIRLKKAARTVQVENTFFDSLKPLVEKMTTDGLGYDYQVAWLDLLNNEPRGILSLANYCDSAPNKALNIESNAHAVPKLPFSLIQSWNMKLFNQFFIKRKKEKEQLGLEDFNNPLDKIAHWNRLYGPKGLVQFQAVFHQDNGLKAMEHLLHLIHLHKASPTLTVLKLFTQPGEGLLSFCNPGFTIAIDFIHNNAAREAIKAMNQLITEQNGRIYLAKDLLLSSEQYQKMYPKHADFSQILNDYECPMSSDLAQRLRITQ